MAERITREEQSTDLNSNSDADFDGTVKRCEKEKLCIAKEVQKLKEEMVEFRNETLTSLPWKDSLTIFDNAEKDLVTNLEESSQLKSMRGELQRELAELAQQASVLKRLVLSGEETSAIGERKTRALNETYTEKQEVVHKIDSTLKANVGQRSLILGALRNVAKTLMARLYEEKLKYCDLKFNMCSFLQEYHKLKKKYKDAEKTLKLITESPSGGLPSPTNIPSISRTLEERLNDLDNLAQKKLTSFGIKANIAEGKEATQGSAPGQPSRVSGVAMPPTLPTGAQSPPPPESESSRPFHGNNTTPPKPRAGKDHANKQSTMSIFKDRSLDISRNSHLSVKSNVSKRYEANDEDEDSREDGSEEEQMGDARSTNKYPGSYLERSNNQFRSMISTPDKSITKVRGISPIGPQREGNSYFLSPER
jgi:hypothetical protein